MISNYLDTNDFAHIRMMLRQEAETDNGYAASVIQRLDATEEYINNKL